MSSKKVIIILLVILKSLFSILGTEKYSLKQNFVFTVIVNVDYVVFLSYKNKLSIQAHFKISILLSENKIQF